MTLKQSELVKGASSSAQTPAIYPQCLWQYEKGRINVPRDHSAAADGAVSRVGRSHGEVLLIPAEILSEDSKCCCLTFWMEQG